MLIYRYDTQAMKIAETESESDIEFRFILPENSPHIEGLKQVRDFFENNEVYTDVLFYAFPNHEYIANVRKDYYTDFILALFKRKLVQSVEWTP
ncbi:hypothetical protein [Paenibacillus thermotolerans]|uniref:hypothetical protein n=1 Tax=Paenibacillus thermotolerans TaxID=3027807 RepID=UPI002367FD18|nr:MULTISPECIES: hypothetical protein [unclassified Paenibacillus]